MDLDKTGQFISSIRKQKNMTQKELADKIGVTDKAVSRWETGRGLPDSSSWQALGDVLEVSVNELLKGERIEPVAFIKEADKTLINSIKFTKKQAKTKMTLLCALTTLLALFLAIMIILVNNNSFFKEHYTAQIGGRQIAIPVPRHSYYSRTGGEWIAAFKTLKNHDEVSVFIDGYLSKLEAVEINGNIAYYDSSQDITIYNYRYANDGMGLINTIYIGYEDGKLDDK